MWGGVGVGGGGGGGGVAGRVGGCMVNLLNSNFV